MKDDARQDGAEIGGLVGSDLDVADVSRGTFHFPGNRPVLFSEEIELELHALPRLQPRAAADAVPDVDDA
jgi:hypothetical protein